MQIHVNLSLGKVCTLGFSEDTAHEIISYQSQIYVGMSDEKVCILDITEAQKSVIWFVNMVEGHSYFAGFCGRCMLL
jgi:hypothetical protein